MEAVPPQTSGRSASDRLPVIAIVGRPNVGKSTLFNRLIGRRLAVVENTPGITRDRLYAEAEWRGNLFNLVDTGGVLLQHDDPLVEQIRLQAQIAIAEADVILFMVDAMEGITPADEELADLLRATRKPILLIANKADNDRYWTDANEFYALGIGELMPVSSLHGTGIGDVLDRATELLPPASNEPIEEEVTRVAIVGRPNVGKSSLVNAITGEGRVIVSDIPGTTRDAIDTRVEWNGHPIILIDTAGLRRPGQTQGSIEYYMALRTKRAIERSDLALVVIDGREGITDGDKRAARYAAEMNKAMVWVVNKWDLVEPPDGKPKERTPLKTEFAQVVRNDMPSASYAVVAYVSAKFAVGLDPMLDAAVEAADNYAFRISTGQLNRIIQEAAFERPPTFKGDPLKIYYATMPSTKPPTVVLFVNNPDRLHFSYRRYLENRIRKHFPLEGTPIRIEAKLSTGRERPSDRKARPHKR